jgi:hypothetical protein
MARRIDRREKRFPFPLGAQAGDGARCQAGKGAAQDAYFHAGRHDAFSSFRYAVDQLRSINSLG